MKNSLPLGLMFFLPSLAWAQVTITNADMPNGGDSVRVSYALTIGAVDHTLTDTNYVWDYSFLVPSAQERIEFNQPSAFPFNFLSDMGVTNYSPDSLPGIGAIPTNFTDYFKSTSSSFRQVGSTFEYPPVTTIALPIIYSAADYVYRFPLQYGNIDSCDAAYSLSIPNLGYIGQSRHRVNVVDGWGTLITPLDTYQVVRVRSVVDARDTVSFDTSNQTGYGIQRPTEIQYKWLAPGMKMPVLEIDAQVLFNAEVVTNIQYQDTLRDSLFQVSVAEEQTTAPQVAVYPNPSDGMIIVAFQQPDANDLELTICDMQGQIVWMQNVKNAGSAGYVEIDISQFSSGIYTIAVQSGQGKSVSRIVKY